MKESTSLVGVAGILLVLGAVSVGAWRALEPEVREKPRSAPLEMAAAPTAQPQDVQVADTTQRPTVESARQPVAAAAPQAPDPSSVRSTRLVARVVDGSSLPLEGAALGRHAGDERARPSASNGRVTLELDDGDLSLWGRGNQGPQVFVVACPGHATLFLRMTPRRGGEKNLGDLELAPGGSISGRVVDEFGEPLTGVPLHASHSRLEGASSAARSRGPDLDPGLPSAVSGSGGTFTLSGVPVGSARVWGQGDDGAWSFTDPVEVRARAEASDIELVLTALEQRDRIVGVVLDPEGEPVPNAWIRYHFPPHVQSGRQTTADAGGFFEILLEAREPYDIRAEDPHLRLTPAVARGIEPGTLDLVLRLTEPRWIDVRAWDADGDPLVLGLRARAQSGLPLSDDPNGTQGSPDSGGVRVRVPVEPFRVVVTVPGYAEATQGPFEPHSPPAALDFELEALAGIRGRVVHGGEPVAGASVRLHAFATRGTDISTMGFRMRMDPFAETSATTDDEGRFQLAAEMVDQCVLLVIAESFARAEWGPLQIDPHIPVEGVEIEMVRGGAIEGRVIPPAGREAVGLLVSISRGDGDVRFERTDDEGQYRFEGLTPGGWNVAYRTHEPKQSWHYGGSSESWEPRWDCQVVDGNATRYDIDLRFESLAVVSGRLLLDDQPAAGWTAQAVERYAADLIEPLRPVVLDAQGRFELRVSPGTYELSLQGPAEDHGQVRFVRKVEIGEGGLQWNLALGTGGLQGTSALGPRSIRYLSSLPDDVTCWATLQPDDDGLFSLAGIPAGHGTLHRIQWNKSSDRDTWTRLRELDIEPGTVLELELD